MKSSQSFCRLIILPFYIIISIIDFFLDFWFAATLLVVISWFWCFPLVISLPLFCTKNSFCKSTDTVLPFSYSTSDSSDIVEYSELDSEVQDNSNNSEPLSNIKFWISFCFVNILFRAAIIFEWYKLCNLLDSRYL